MIDYDLADYEELFDLKYGMGGLSHQALMTNIEHYGRQVIPRVRELLAMPVRS